MGRLRASTRRSRPVTITFNHKTYRERSNTGTFRQTLKAPSRRGRYTITFKAVGGNTTQTVRKTIKVT